jgi:hypothetical protein
MRLHISAIAWPPDYFAEIEPVAEEHAAVMAAVR